MDPKFRGVDQVIKFMISFCGIENLIALMEYVDKNEKVLYFIEWSSLVFLWSSFEKDDGGRRLRASWWLPDRDDN
jgi:hypothetical protein